MNKEFDEFVGDKLDKITIVFSFRLSVKQINELIDGKRIPVDIRGKRFYLEKEK